MKVETKFILCYVAITVLALVAAGLGYKAYDLQQTINAAPKPATPAPLVAAAVKTNATNYYKSTSADIAVNSANCVTTDTPDSYSCTMTVSQPSTGKTASANYTVVWTKAKGIVSLKAA